MDKDHFDLGERLIVSRLASIYFTSGALPSTDVDKVREILKDGIDPYMSSLYDNMFEAWKKLVEKHGDLMKHTENELYALLEGGERGDTK